MGSSDSSNRSLLAFAATCVAAGVAFSVTGSHGLGAWVTVAALALLVFSLHRLGRSGPDAPLEVEPTHRDEEPD
jgi:O-antigen ligase